MIAFTTDLATRPEQKARKLPMCGEVQWVGSNRRSTDVWLGTGREGPEGIHIITLEESLED